MSKSCSCLDGTRILMVSSFRSVRVWYFFSLAVFHYSFEVPFCWDEAFLEPAGHLFVCFGLSWGFPFLFFLFSAVPFVPPRSHADLLVSFGEGIVPKWSQNRSQMDPEHILEAASCARKRSSAAHLWPMLRLPLVSSSHRESRSVTKGLIGIRWISCANVPRGTPPNPFPLS